ncbi:MAG TPA: RNA polymerase sigma factor [Tepidisphaeraceae bacterium]|nr:RNA polymerase sigma factor [Tepidisphaeraceae bacterium]
MDNSADWNTWLSEHGPTMLLLVRQWVSNRADSEDIVQEAFVRFWKSRHRAVDPKAYLYVCAKRYLLEWLRTEERRGRREQSVARVRPSVSTTLFKRLAAREDHRRLESSLVALPAEQREIVILRIWGGLSFPQISEALAIPLNTASSRYRYALATLRKKLVEESIHD